jgi:DNA-binding response OmpR family regulator
MKILVVEDEEGIADFVRRGLEAEGYEVTCAFDGLEGETQALGGEFDLIVLDQMLPGRDGLAVLSNVRESLPGLPVILLTARGEVADRVAGLDAGAVDYMTKPFAFDELAARVRAHLRQPETARPTRLEAGGIVVDLIRRRVTREGIETNLSAREFDLLAYLVRHADRVVARDELLSAVWGYQHDPGTNVVGVYVGYLRRKLAQPGRPAPIETVRGAGYRLRARD